MSETPGPSASLGDVPPEEMRAALHRMADWVADYRETLRDRSILASTAPGEIAMTQPGTMPEHGEPLAAITGDMDRIVMPGILHWGHPGFLGYFGSTSNGPALLGEMAAAALNVSAMTWKTSPAATELEQVVLQWIRELLGFPRNLFGIVYDTASVAVLHALAAARERALPGARGSGLVGRNGARTMRVYASDQAHSSIGKAMAVLGLGENNLVKIPTDESFRMDVAALRAAMDDDARSGHQSLAVIATIGTTSTASIDDVAQIADICAERGAWLHVDAAYGGALGVIPELRPLMAGIERADSIVVNPHKWLFVPLDFSALYVREPALLRATFSSVPEYLRGDAGDAEASDGAVVNYMDYGIQLGRRFRALKAWMVFRSFGRSGIEARIREHLRLAALLAKWAHAKAGFRVMAPVTMAVVCIRYERSGRAAEEQDADNERLAAVVNAGGATYITHTSLRGRTCLRLGIGNIATTESDVARAWTAIVNAARLL